MADWAEKTGHTWTSRMIEIAKLSSPKQILITHINPLIGAVPVEGCSEAGDLPGDFEPECRQIAKKSGAEVVMAADQLVIDF